MPWKHREKFLSAFREYFLQYAHPQTTIDQWGRAKGLNYFFNRDSNETAENLMKNNLPVLTH